MLGFSGPISEACVLQVKNVSAYILFYFAFFFSPLLFTLVCKLNACTTYTNSYFLKISDVSRADFSEEPAFSWMSRLSVPVKTAIHQSKILFCNGYAFDELCPDLINSALYCAIDAGTAVFFDPGPRGQTLLIGTPEQQGALEKFLKLSDVLLLTSDEVHSLTS